MLPAMITLHAEKTNYTVEKYEPRISGEII